MYNACVVSCSTGDLTCNSNCLRDYTSNLELCPCQPGCPNGCPCDIYQCPETTTAVTSTTTAATTTSSTTSTTTTRTTKAPSQATEVLVLNTRKNADNVPIITNAAGRQDTNFEFVFGEGTQVYLSCSMTWKNDLYVFGGNPNKRQISQLVGCQLTQIGELEFDHHFGACANVADEKLYLCFGSGDSNKCRVTLSPTGVYEGTNRSSFDHRETRIAASEGNHCNCFVGSLFQMIFSHWAPIIHRTRKPKSCGPIATLGRGLVIIPIV